MFEIKVRIEAPELSQAIMALGGALKGSIILSPGGIETKISGVQAPSENPTTNTFVSGTVENVPAAQTYVQPVSAEQQQVFMNPPEPVPSPAPVPAPTASSVPAPTPAMTPAPKVDMGMISRAGASLIDQGRFAEVMALLSKYGVQAVNKLDPSQFDAFAADLRALGANI